MRTFSRRAIWFCVGAVSLVGVAVPFGDAACCYFSAKDKDVNQPAQKAFITFDGDKKEESFTVQPKFEGNAADFGMVIPTPARPKLDEMPRDYFKELAVFTILKPMDMTKYKMSTKFSIRAAAGGGIVEKAKHSVKVLEAGVVGSLDYKILQADQADDLYQWLKDNNYTYSGDQKTLDFYIQKKWFFTTMKIDPKQMKKKDDGSYEGEVTPTRFTFASEKIVYPLKITQLSVKDKTEALFYVQAKEKMDLPKDFSYEMTFVPMWNQALSYAIAEKVTDQEKTWRDTTKDVLPKLQQQEQDMVKNQRQPATLEWAKKITQDDVDMLGGDKKYDREAPQEDVDKLKLLKGHVQKGLFITKLRKVFGKDEMGEDLEFVRAMVEGKEDNVEHFSILPTSPP